VNDVGVRAIAIKAALAIPIKLKPKVGIKKL
jgi:hypothetical protein